MKTIKVIGAGVLLGAVLVTSACGGESDVDKRVKELSGLTHTQFSKKLDDICSEDDSAEDKANEAAVQRAFEAEDYGKAADLIQEQLSEAKPVMEKLHEIEPPAEDKASFDKWLDSLDDAITAYEPFVEALRSDGGPEFTTMMALGSKVEEITKRGNTALTSLDAPACVDA